MNCCTSELKIQSSKYIQKISLFWLSISSASKSFQLPQQNKEALYNRRRNKAELNHRILQVIQEKNGKRLHIPCTLLLSFIGLMEHLSCQAGAVYMVKSGRDRECSELGKDLTDLGNTGNATGDQILLSMERRTPRGDPRAVSQYLQGGLLE